MSVLGRTMNANPFCPIATLSTAVIFLCALFFLVFPLRIAPSFAALFQDFGADLPLITRIVMRPSSSAIALFFLAGGLTASRFRPRERTILLSLTAGGGISLVLAFVAALYLPVLTLAGQIK